MQPAACFLPVAAALPRLEYFAGLEYFSGYIANLFKTHTSAIFSAPAAAFDQVRHAAVKKQGFVPAPLELMMNTVRAIYRALAHIYPSTAATSQNQAP